MKLRHRILQQDPPIKIQEKEVVLEWYECAHFVPERDEGDKSYSVSVLMTQGDSMYIGYWMYYSEEGEEYEEGEWCSLESDWIHDMNDDNLLWSYLPELPVLQHEKMVETNQKELDEFRKKNRICRELYVTADYEESDVK